MSCDKIGYSKRAAETVRNQRRHRRHGGGRRGRAKVLRIYECPACGQWHLTSKP